MSRLDFNIFHAKNGIPAEIQESWRNIQLGNSTLRSPFFAPEFTEIVANNCGEVEVAVWKQGGEIVALFPYERKKWNFAGPVGRFLSDYDGLIARPEFVRDPRQILRDCGLSAWDFRHSLVTENNFSQLRKASSEVVLTNIDCNFEDYINGRRAAGKRQVGEYLRKMRKLEQDIGPLRFVPHSTDEALLRKLMELKSAQYRRNRWRDIFAIPWVRQVLQSIHQTQSPRFAGMLCALYAGEQLVALHFGIRSLDLRHSWFPVYDVSYSKYSPGIVLTLKLLENCHNLGIRTIDWGSGEHQHKHLLDNSFISTSSGSVELPCAAAWARRLWLPLSSIPRRTRGFIGKLQIGVAALPVRRWIRSQ